MRRIRRDSPTTDPGSGLSVLDVSHMPPLGHSQPPQRPKQAVLCVGCVTPREFSQMANLFSTLI